MYYLSFHFRLFNDDVSTNKIASHRISKDVHDTFIHILPNSFFAVVILPAPHWEMSLAQKVALDN
jgi:hypothetical protein